MRALLLFLAGCTSEIAPRYVHLSHQPSRLSGVAVDAEGHPAGPFVLSDGDFVGDHEGPFGFPLVPGDYSLRGFSDGAEGRLDISLEPGEELDGLVLELLPPPADEDQDQADQPSDELDPRSDAFASAIAQPERSVTVHILDDSGHPLRDHPIQAFESTPLDDGSCLAGVSNQYTDLDGNLVVSVPELPTRICPEIHGYVGGCVEVDPRDRAVTAHYRQGFELLATIRGAPDDVEIHCGPSTRFLDADHRVRITCPAGLGRVEIDSDPPRAFSLSGEPGQTLYGIVEL